MKMKKTKEERLEIVLDIVKKLSNFPTITGTYINLYEINCPAINELKMIFNRYLAQDDRFTELLVGETGKIKFPEIGRRIEFILPIKKTGKPTFILKSL